MAIEKFIKARGLRYLADGLAQLGARLFEQLYAELWVQPAFLRSPDAADVRPIPFGRGPSLVFAMELVR